MTNLEHGHGIFYGNFLLPKRKKKLFKKLFAFKKWEWFRVQMDLRLKGSIYTCLCCTKTCFFGDIVYIVLIQTIVLSDKLYLSEANLTIIDICRQIYTLCKVNTYKTLLLLKRRQKLFTWTSWCYYAMCILPWYKCISAYILDNTNCGSENFFRLFLVVVVG